MRTLKKRSLKTFFILLSISVMFTEHPCFAQQAPKITWESCFGGAENDGASSVVPASNGTGYVFAGYTRSHDGDVIGYHGSSETGTGYDYGDVWVACVDSGRLIWQSCLGGSGAEKASCIIGTADGGYAIAGWTESASGDGD